MRQFTNSRLSSFFCGLLAFYLLNISIDPPDRFSDTIPEDLTINDQESILEVIIEKVMGYENAIAEYDDNDQNQENASKNKVSADHFILNGYESDRNSVDLLGHRRFGSFYFERIPMIHLEVHSPPPQA